MKTGKRCLVCALCFLAIVLCAIGLTACETCSHSWGKWTVTKSATCTEAGIQKRECSKCGKTETSEVEVLSHDWKDATCQEPKTCKNCSATEGSLSGHTPSADDGDCTTDILCSVCGAVTISGNATHTGGEATCTNKANCELCGKEYGELAEHTPIANTDDCTIDVLCSACGIVTIPGNESHIGGEATCVNKAACEICGKEYGELAEHIPNADDGDCTTDILCSVCNAVMTPGNATHTGGEATCTNKAVCDICGKEYGELAEHIPEADDGDCATDIHCSVCGAVTENTAHVGGEATCTNKAVCEICGKEYGELAEHIPEADDGDCSTDILCSVCGAVTENTAHVGGEATCTNKSVCEICGKEYGELAEHIPNADDGDCTTDILCSVCGAVTIPGNEAHTGGEVTCINKAACEICGKEYGELAEHIPNADDGDCTTDIHCSVCGVVTTLGNESHTGGKATCLNRATCEICGTEYGDPADCIPNADDGNCTTDICCSVCGVTIIPGNATHTGGMATCIDRAACEICGTAYGELAEHIPEADDGDCTTDIHCSVCGVVTTLGNETHVGGEATCINKAACEICGTAYGELAEHIPEADDGDCTTDIHCSVCGVVTTLGNETHVGGEATCINKAACEICGTAYGELAEHIPEADDGDCTTDIHCSVCGAVTVPGNENHMGGTATCIAQANCEICGTAYGEFAEHIPEADDGDCTTDIVCSICDTVTTPGNATHTGGTATCAEQALCDVCGIAYGDLLEHIPNADDGDCTTDILCSVCGAVTTPGNESHTGGEATCTNKAVCEICGTAYGELAEHIPEADDGDCSTDVLCSVCGAVTESIAHIGGEATCTNKAVCDVCGKEYGELAEHIPNADDGDCTTDIHCSVCGAVTVPGNENHMGGTATCIAQANCEICGTAYGELAEHIPNADDGDCTTDIHCSVCGVVTTLGNETHIGGDATCINKAACEICGTAYGELAEHIPNADDGDCTTDIHCSVCGAVTVPGNENHTGGTATCIAQANCEICGTAYGELAEHIPEADDGDCSTDVLCSVCGAVTENTAHVGGEATCTNKAVCEICGKEYGKLAEHIPNADDGDCTTDILCSVCGVVTTIGNETHVGGEATCINKAVCEICGTAYGELAEHIPNPDDYDSTTDVLCSICGSVTIPGKGKDEVIPTIIISSVEAVPGETQVCVVISIMDNPGIIGLTMSVQYSSSSLTLTDARSGSALDVLTFTEPSNLNSGCTFLWDAVEIQDQDIKHGEILILTFDVSSSAPEGAYSILLNVSAFDNDLNSISLITIGGKILVKNN